MKFSKRCSSYRMLQVSILSMTMLAALSASSQSMGISSTAITPDASSILEMRTTTKGLLIPRMTTTERDNINSPATGLVVYNTTTNKFNFYNGSSWTVLFDMSAILTSTYGGTGNGFTKFSGATSSEKTYTLPDASTTILTKNYTGALSTGIVKNTTSTGELTIAVPGDFPTLNQNTTGSAATLTTSRNIYGNAFNGSADLTQVITPTYGGTGIGSYTVGDILYASASTTLSKLAGVATGNALISGGVATAPSWGKIGLTTHVSGTLPIANGGTNSTATPTDGGIVYGDGTSYQVTAAGTTGQILQSAGSSIPTWVNGGSMMFAGQSNNTAVNNTTLYFPILGGQAGNATDAQAGTRSLMSRAGTVRNLYVEISAALAAGKTGTVTVMKNGVATSLVATLSVGPSVFTDLANSVTIAAGDEVGIKVTTTGNVKFSWSAEFHF